MNIIDDVLTCKNVSYEYGHQNFYYYYIIIVTKNKEYVKSFKLYKSDVVYLLKHNKKLIIDDIVKNTNNDNIKLYY